MILAVGRFRAHRAFPALSDDGTPPLFGSTGMAPLINVTQEKA